MLKKSFLLTSLLLSILSSSSSFAANAPGCSCWRWGYKAAVVKYTKEAAEKSKYFQMCAGKIESKTLVGSTSNYWQGWDAGLKKSKMVCPYTDSSKNPT